MRVLHVAAEVYPLVKTGGLADVVAALPPAERRRVGTAIKLAMACGFEAVQHAGRARGSHRPRAPGQPEVTRRGPTRPASAPERPQRVTWTPRGLTAREPDPTL